MLTKAKADGLAALPEIARQESFRLNLPYEMCSEYLSDIMVYDMGERAQRGFELFREKVIEHGLLNTPVDGR